MIAEKIITIGEKMTSRLNGHFEILVSFKSAIKSNIWHTNLHFVKVIFLGYYQDPKYWRKHQGIVGYEGYGDLWLLTDVTNPLRTPPWRHRSSWWRHCSLPRDVTLPPWRHSSTSPYLSSHHSFSFRTCSSSAGVKSFLMLNVRRISSGVFPLIMLATVLHVTSSRPLMSR